MAKKQTEKVTLVENTEVNVTHETTALEATPVQRNKNPRKDNTWEMKDRYYYLKGNKSPLTCRLKTRGMFYFDEDKGYEREIRYTRNQNTPFVEDMKGQVRLGHIVFKNGVLMVPKNMQNLQKFLSIYHPGKNSIYAERDEVKVAEDMMDIMETELEAMNTAVSMDIDIAEAIMRAEIGSRVSEMSSKELKRDLLVFAKRSPSLFLAIANDPNVQLRNIGIRATEIGVIKLSPDQRTFSWGTNDRKLMTVPFDEHPYSALAAWFKTDEGMEIYSNIEKRLK